MTDIIRAIGLAISLIGLFIFTRSIIILVNIQSATTIIGTIIDYVQEYTTRGFLWRAKVRYMWNNKEYLHIMRVSTLKRGTDTIKLYIGKNGKVYEKEGAIRDLVFGLFTLVLTIVVFVIEMQM